MWVEITKLLRNPKYLYVHGPMEFEFFITKIFAICLWVKNNFSNVKQVPSYTHESRTVFLKKKEDKFYKDSHDQISNWCNKFDNQSVDICTKLNVWSAYKRKIVSNVCLYRCMLACMVQKLVHSDYKSRMVRAVAR